MSDTDDLEEDEIPGLRPDGTPDPAYAAALGLVPASPARRSLAFAIDAAIVAILAIPSLIGVLVFFASFDPTSIDLGALLFPLILLAVGEVLVTVYYVIQIVLHGLRGITVGKAICGIRSVRVTTFARPGFWRMVLRGAVFGASLVVVPMLGCIPFLLSPLWDPQKRGRGWLDRLGGNWLLNVRSGLDPSDAKALRLARKRLAAPPKRDEEQLPSLATGAGVPTFVPGTRSSSGVIGAAPEDADLAPAGPWSPPTVGPRGPGAPASTQQPSATTLSPPEPPESPAPAVVASEAAQPDPGAHGAATLVFDDGTALVVDGIGLIGRNPKPQPGEQVHHLIPVHDESMRISKTHAEFGLDPHGLWITDRSSVNGTRVVSPEGERSQVPVGRHVAVGWGSVVELGGRAFRVVREASDASGRPVGGGNAEEVR